MENYTHKMTDEDKEILMHCNSFAGNMFDIEDFGNFITDAISTQLFELMGSKKEHLKPTKEEFGILMCNIDNFKVLMQLIIDKRINDIRD